MTGPYFDHTERAQLLRSARLASAPCAHARGVVVDDARSRLRTSSSGSRNLPAAPGLVVPGVWHRFAECRSRVFAATDFSALVSRLLSGASPCSLPGQPVASRSEPQRVLRPPRGRTRRANGRAPRILGPAMDEGRCGPTPSAGPASSPARARSTGSEVHWAGMTTSVRSDAARADSAQPHPRASPAPPSCSREGQRRRHLVTGPRAWCRRCGIWFGM